MDRLLKEYLEAAYDSPFEIKVNKSDLYFGIDVYCKGECIAHGDINEGKDWKYVTWTIPIGPWNNMSNYIPPVKPEKYTEIISWIRRKCKKQGISLPGVTNLNLK